ncbi:protein XNDC1N isoform X2 [Sinocyclocheilus grahami]|uniref:protein XNDC1N isoform X2 n=1 Tax=Sinocyclocheilus grahami TaxID=75366 RepID=UPI0007AC9F72|nr:PREDICTED: short transient receptor potential channel 2-like isoform X2 [Sinocyclocheilus grahami]
MAPNKIKHIVSFTSQDSKNGVNNLCDGSDSSRPWLCSIQDRSGVLRVELQMERASAIGFIDVDVGRSSWSLDHPYVTLLPTATLMSPADSKQGIGRQNVRMFKKADFLSQTAKESWDRLRVTCTQPFNKLSQFGLSFLRIRTMEDEAEDSSVQHEDIAAENLRTPEKMTSVMEWLSSPAIQSTFFGRITGNVSSDAQKNAGSLSRAERMVIAAHSNRRSLSTSPCSTTSSTTPPREDNVKTPPGGFRTSSDQIKTPQEQRKKSKARQSLINSGAQRKKSRPTASTHKPSSTNPHRSAHQVPQGSPETRCPLCGESFSPDYLPFHASTCLDGDSAELMGVRETGVMSSQHSSVFGSGADEQHMVSCPLCSFRFPPDCIQQHASTCGDTV